MIAIIVLAMDVRPFITYKTFMALIVKFVTEYIVNFESHHF